MKTRNVWEYADIKPGTWVILERMPNAYLIISTNFADSRGIVYALVNLITGVLYTSFQNANDLAEELTNFNAEYVPTSGYSTMKSR